MRKMTLLLVVLASLAATIPAVASAAPPKLGTYKGTISTNATGNQPPEFLMKVGHEKCAAPGSKVRHRAYCVTVATTSTVQAACGNEFVDAAFFPVDEPVALSAKNTISHTYTLYFRPGGQIVDYHEAGTTAIGSFEYSLKLTTNGVATGTANMSFTGEEGVCNSGPLTISARRK